MTSAHSTRNTSIRTRKIRGEDSLLSSISISEREEGPEGIASVIRYEKPRWRQYGTAGRIKKLGVLRFRDRPKWNRILRRAPISAPVGTAGCPTRIQIGNVVHRAVFRLRRAPGGEYDRWIASQSCDVLPAWARIWRVRIDWLETHVGARVEPHSQSGESAKAVVNSGR